MPITHPTAADGSFSDRGRSAWNEAHTLPDSSEIPYTPSGSGLEETTVQGAIEELATVGGATSMFFAPGGADSFMLNPTDNEMDAAVTQSVNFGAGSDTQPCILGVVNAVPTGTDLTPGWAADADYVAGSADQAGIFGGYDEVNNSVASVIVNAPHCMISYNVTGHSNIFGGTYNWVGPNATRSSIYGSRGGTITGGNIHSLIGGLSNGISSTNSQCSIIGGTLSVISGATTNATIIGGSSNTVSATSAVIVGGSSNTASNSEAVVLGGSTNTASGQRALVAGGFTNVASGSESAIIGGRNNTNAKQDAVAMGQDVVALAAGGHHIGRTKLSIAADAQAISVVMAVRTTNDTIGTMQCNGNENIVLGDSHATTGTGKILLVGMRDGSAAGNDDADYTQVAYTVEFGFYWDGTNGFLFKSGTQTAVTSAPTLALDLISQTNNDFTAGAAPIIALSTGAFRIRPTGIAATIINWVAKVDLVMTRVANDGGP